MSDALRTFKESGSIDCAGSQRELECEQMHLSKATIVVEKDKTKIASSFRSFHLVPEAEEIFRAAKQAEQSNRRLFGRDYQNNDYVFKWPDGHPFPPDYVT